MGGAVAVIVGAIASSVSTGMAAGFLSAKFFTALAINLAIGAALSIAQKALTPKPKIPNLQPNFSSFGETAQSRLVNIKQAIMARQTVYGTRRVAGNLVYASTTEENKFLHLIFALCGHEIQSFEAFQVNEDDVTIDANGFVEQSKYKSGSTSFIRIKLHTGADDQTADSDLVSEDSNWTTNHRLRGIAYMYVRLQFSNDIFPNGIPNISTIIKGKKVYDPRTTSTLYTANSALCLRDYLLNTRFGLSVNSTEINDTIFTSAANTCDETITLATPNSKTFNTETSIGESDNIITINGHTYETADAVQYSNESGTNVSGLSSGTTYYVIRVTRDTIKLATSESNANGGTAITISPASEGAGQTQALKTLTEKRYECHGILDTGSTPAKIIEDMTSSCIGLVYYSGGKWGIKVGEYLTPAVTLGEGDLRDRLSVTTRNSRRDSFNSIKGVFSDPKEKYQPTDFPSIISSTFKAEDNAEEIFRDIELPFTTSSAMAQRIAKIILYRNREQITLNYPAKLTGFNVEVGDTMLINNTRLGFTNKPFEVASWSFATNKDGTLGLDLQLREISSAVYNWSAEESEIISNNTTLPNPFDPTAPTLTVSDTLTTFNQEAITVLQATVSSTDSFVDQFEVQAKQSTATDYISMGRATDNKYELVNVQDNVVYNVRARAITTLGTKSEYQSVDHLVIGKTAPPQDVQDFSVNIVGEEAHLSWTPVADLDLSHYKIRHSKLTSGATYANSMDIVPKVARPAQSISVPAVTGTYFCKAVDKLGNTSLGEASSVAIIDKIKFQNIVGTITENPSFAGTKVNVVKTTAGKLILDTTNNFDSVSGNFDDVDGNFDAGGGAVATTGSYEFATKFDTGGKFTSKLTPNFDISRVDNATFFDDALGDFDAKEGFFDGLFDSTTVEFFVATTDDDPNSGSATFTDFRRFISGDYTARGFKFKLVLNSTDVNATPQVNTLGMEIDMPDRTVAENDIASGTSSSGKVITFSGAFKGLSGVGISAGNLASGDYYAITNKSATGFTIKFFNSGGSVVNRTFDYVARGFGELSA
tara:strand:- start:1600 stop:4746 length:3147 start_codon:yes stop_codon:yes gene_type:complete